MRTNSTATNVLVKLKCSLVSLCLAVASINSSPLLAQGEDVDIEVPQITQIQKRTGALGQSQTIIATVIDNREVQYVTLLYRFGSASDYTAEPMKLTTGNRYEATLLTDQKSAKLLQYYVETADTSGNSTFRGYAFSPMTLQLTPDLLEPSDGIATADAPTDLSVTQPVGSEPVKKSGSGNRTLYTVLGVLAAAAVVGAVAADGRDGDPPIGGGSEGDTVTVTFTSTTP